MTAILWLLVAVPAAVGAVLATAGQRAGRLAAPVGLRVAVLTLAGAIAVAVGRPTVRAPFLAGLPVRLAVDGLSAALVVTVAIATLAVLVFAAGDLADDPARARFHGLILLFAGAMLLTVTATTLLGLLIGWEVMGAMSYALIGFWWREPERTRAAGTAFLTTRAADLGLYLAAGAALAGAGTLQLAGLPQARGAWLHAVTAGVLVAALGKSAQLPFSFWLSRAMQAPSPVSALLHSATMVAAGGYLLLRLAPLLRASGWGDDAAAWVGAATALLLGAVAVVQTDLKQLLAASTAAQLGFVVLAAGVGGVAGGRDHLIAHAATKSLLFLAAGAWLTALGTRDLSELRGAARRFPVVGLTAAAGLLSLAGLPPLSLWWTKDQLLAAAYDRSPSLYAVGLAGAVLSAAYAGRALGLLTRPLPAATERRRVGWLEQVPLVVLAVGAVGLGALLLLPGPPGAPHPAGWELALSGVLTAGTLVAAIRTADQPVPAAGLLGPWLGLEAAANTVLVRPTLALAHGLARFDDRVLDRVLVMGTVAAGRSLAGAARHLDESSLDGVVRGVARGALRLGTLARRPQTGQLHTYYAQASVVLTVLAAVFVALSLLGR